MRPQHSAPDIDYLFAPLKRTRLDYMVQKATEMGVARLASDFHPPHHAGPHQWRTHACQCDRGRRAVRHLAGTGRARRRNAQARRSRTGTSGGGLFSATRTATTPIRWPRSRARPGPLALLIGPEGGFDDAERELVTSQAFAVRISLGPRILRADTAAVAALALVNATLGDWR